MVCSSVHTPLRSLALVVFLMGCGSDRTIDPTTDAGFATDSSGRADVDTGDVVWVINVVVADGATGIQSYLDGASEDALYAITTRFYETYDDEFDFLYLLAEVDHGTGRYSGAHRAAMPENGLPSAADDPGWGSASRLKGVVALRLGDSGNGPTLHETSHHWGMFLDSSFGFGRDRTMNFGPHWGVASVNGQLGGFDRATLRCVSPDGAMPPCVPEAGGRIRYTVASFGPSANGGDTVPYAPLELYLMGLVPASELSVPVAVLREADFIEVVPGEERMLFEADGIDEVTIADITAVHGEKTPLGPDERSLRGAFLLVTDEPATDAAMEAARRWSRVFGGVDSSPSLLSFEAATGGRATMDTSIVRR